MTKLSSFAALPEPLRRYFWDVDPDRISWPAWEDFLIGRLLRSGDREAVDWLLTQVSETELAQWLRAHSGGGLSPQRLRYWQLLLDLPAADVDAWIAKTKEESWGARTRR